MLFVVKEDTVEMRSVKVGMKHNGSVEIVSGLAAGEEVVISGHNDLKNGDRVRRT